MDDYCDSSIFLHIFLHISPIKIGRLQQRHRAQNLMPSTEPRAQAAP